MKHHASSTDIRNTLLFFPLVWFFEPGFLSVKILAGNTFLQEENVHCLGFWTIVTKPQPTLIVTSGTLILKLIPTTFAHGRIIMIPRS